MEGGEGLSRRACTGGKTDLLIGQNFIPILLVLLLLVLHVSHFSLKYKQTCKHTRTYTHILHSNLVPVSISILHLPQFSAVNMNPFPAL